MDRPSVEALALTVAEALVRLNVPYVVDGTWKTERVASRR